MVEIMDRRMTRSLSNELQARAAVQSNSFVFRNAHDSAYGYSQHGQQNSSHGHMSVQSLSHVQGHGHGSGAHMHTLDMNFQQHHLSSNGGEGMMNQGGPTYLRNNSEEMFLNSLMNSSLVPGTPTMEAAASLGFMDTMHPQSNQHSPHALRGNSEELFNNWITTDNSNHENSNHNNQNGVYSAATPSPSGNRPRQNSRRMSSELQAIIAQQHGASWAPRPDNVEHMYLQPNSYLSEDFTSNGNDDDKERSNLPKDKGDYNNTSPLKSMWFNSTSPMTRSRSSELRRRYAQLEGLPFPPTAEALQKLASNGTLDSLANPGMASLGSLTRDIGGSCGSPQNEPDTKPALAQLGLSSASQRTDRHHITQVPPPAGEQQSRSVSDVVGLLKGSLERKKLQTKQQSQQQPQQHQGMRIMQASMSPPLGNNRQEESLNRPPDQRHQMHGEEGTLPFPPMQQQPTNVPHVQSPSESTAAAPSPSAGIATSDGPSNSGVSVQRQALKRGNGAVDSPQAISGFDSPSAHSAGDAYENGTSKLDIVKKPAHLARAGSVTSSLRPGYQVSEIDGATKKRRVERQRKMAEAKGRGNAPPLPADLQAVIKRCDALEKEVRSLKLNLSFMNRKDSEQTKRIEELEQQNEDLKDELSSALNDK